MTARAAAADGRRGGGAGGGDEVEAAAWRRRVAAKRRRVASGGLVARARGRGGRRSDGGGGAARVCVAKVVARRAIGQDRRDRARVVVVRMDVSLKAWRRRSQRDGGDEARPRALERSSGGGEGGGSRGDKVVRTRRGGGGGDAERKSKALLQACIPRHLYSAPKGWARSGQLHRRPSTSEQVRKWMAAKSNAITTRVMVWWMCGCGCGVFPHCVTL